MSETYGEKLSFDENASLILAMLQCQATLEA
jgi:hypothetical protein